MKELINLPFSQVLGYFFFLFLNSGFSKHVVNELRLWKEIKELSTHMHTSIHTCISMYTDAYLYTHMHSYIHTCILIFTHAHLHTHTLGLYLICCHVPNDL